MAAGQALPTATFTPAPTRPAASRTGGQHEGSMALPAALPAPDTRELLIAGSKRFALPLSAHAGVEDYFGTDRGDGLKHAGVDFSLVGLKNIVVQAACAGEVSSTGTDATYGTHVVIDCGAGFTTVYGWLSGLRVAKGNLVTHSTVVGSGDAGGFLHFEIRYQGTPVGPGRVRPKSPAAK